MRSSTQDPAPRAPALKGDDIGLTKGYFGSKEAMGRLWAHTEEETKVTV
jgi:hypothetical protein